MFIGDDGANGKGDELSWIFLLWDGGDMTSFGFIGPSSSETSLSDDAAN